VDLTHSDDSDEKGVDDNLSTNTTIATSAMLSPFTPVITKPTAVSTVLSNRHGVSYAFEGCFGSKEATTQKGRCRLQREYEVHQTLKKSYHGATDLRDLPVVVAMAWSDTGILMRGGLGGFMMRHVDSG
jgi:hypothetical protein